MILRPVTARHGTILQTTRPTPTRRGTAQTCWSVLTSLFLAAAGTLPADAADCAPPAPVPKKPGHSCLVCPKTRLSRQLPPEEYQELVEAVAAALAEAEAGQAAPAAAVAPANFAAPAPTGQVAGASHAVGIRGLEIHFPELRLALPTLQLPSLVKFRREPHMQLDPATAPMVAPAAAPAPAGYFPPYASAPALAPATAAAPAPAAGPASTAPARTANAVSGCRTRVRRVAPARQRFWSNEEEWEVIQDGAEGDCAPDAEVGLKGPAATARTHTATSRTASGRSLQGHSSGGSADGWGAGIPKAPAADAGGPVAEAGDEPIDLPPEPVGTPAVENLPATTPSAGTSPAVTSPARQLQDELDSARAELNAARRQLAQVTQLLSDADLVTPETTSSRPSTPVQANTTAIEPTAATPRQRRGNKSEAIQRLFQELESPSSPPAARAAGTVDDTTDDETTAETTSAAVPPRMLNRKSAIQPAGHATPAKPSLQPTSSAKGKSLPTQPGKGTGPSAPKNRPFGPGHALGR